MHIRVLGPLTVLDDHLRPIPLAPKPKRLLAMLAIDANRAISVTSLARELWGDTPPRTATATIQTYIGQIRRSFAAALGISVAEAAETLLVTEGGSYLLSGGRAALDIAEYEQLAETGTRAVRQGDYPAGALMLRQALALWRGAPLVNVETGELLGARVLHLEESRLCVQEHRIFADLQRGAHHNLMGELVELTSLHPLHETLHGHLMLALYRSGRRAESLAVARRLRRRLVAELGLEPSPFLLQMEQDILRGEASLDPDPSPGDGDVRHHRREPVLASLAD
ncbi:AfsR/SARP family transcriptional regulator [Streptomyces sp. NPDC057245]|uniref:AfsR/SARP family transcriptional regulator n=1 Tax=Streptomyces TaxID=1883 RepID=UPI0027E5B414|nr:AfsR/SARP family transcriptional regulator [Streptomyces sp. A108]